MAAKSLTVQYTDCRLNTTGIGSPEPKLVASGTVVEGPGSCLDRKVQMRLTKVQFQEMLAYAPYVWVDEVLEGNRKDKA